VKPAPSIRGLIWQCTLLLRAASLLVPRSQRPDWYREWHAEIWHWAHFLKESGRLNSRSKLELIRHCWGAFADAAWHRFDQERFTRGLRELPRSARFCLIFLLACFVAVLLASGFVPTIRAAFTRLPYYQPERVAVLSFPNHYAPYPDAGLFESANRWSKNTRTAVNVAAYSFRSSTVWSGDKSFSLWTARVSPNFFETLGNKAEMGRLFLSGNQASGNQASGDQLGCGNCIVLAHRTWETVFKNDPAIVGKTVTVAGIDSLVIGVLPPDFAFLWPEASIWALPPSPQDVGDAGDQVGAVLRLAPGVKASQAALEFRQLARGDRALLNHEKPEVEALVSRPRQAAKVYLIITMCSLLGGLLLVSTRLAAARTAKLHLSRGCVVRWWAFLTVKIVLLLATCLVISIELPGRFSHPLAGEAHALSLPISTWLFVVTSMLALLWSIRDQRRRCRTCLRRMGNEASVGAPSYLLLDWGGTELVCSEGHGVLHVPEMDSSSHEPEKWVHLDESWKPLFAEDKAVSTR
jgi:hypothetical protein